MIYFILDAAGNAVKIGRSVDPARRLKGLQTASPGELTMLGTIAGSASEEAQLHRRFEEHRTRQNGEWFHAGPELLDAIESLLATGSLHRNVWSECVARERCRTGLNGLAMLHVPTGRQFDCYGSAWGPNQSLVLFPRPEGLPETGPFVPASSIGRARMTPTVKYPAGECVLESEWPITCCRPIARACR